MRSFVSVNAKRETEQRCLLLSSFTNGQMVQGLVVRRSVASSNPAQEWNGMKSTAMVFVGVFLTAVRPYS